MNRLGDLNNELKSYELTHPQKRIWYMEKIYSGTPLCNVGGCVKIKGEVDFKILEEAINLLIKRNDALRLKIIEIDGKPKQYVGYYKQSKIDFLDFSKFSDPIEEYERWTKKEAQKPFDILNENLFYFAMYKLSNSINGYMARFHHIICDGWSINVITNQLYDTYIKILNKESVCEENANSYTNYIEHENKYLSSQRYIKNKDFWNEKFKTLPENFLYKYTGNNLGMRKTYNLNNYISQKINELTSEYKCSKNSFFVSIFLVYLFKIFQEDDIVIGTPVFNRSGKKEKNTVGMFTSTMPFRFCMEQNKTFIELLENVNEELINCFYNQKYPYDLLVNDIELKKAGYDNLFNFCVNYYNTKLGSELNNNQIETEEFYNGYQFYSLQLVINEWNSNEIMLNFDYKIEDFSERQIQEMYSCICLIISQVLDNIQQKVKDVSIMTIEEKNKLLYEYNNKTNNYPKEKTIYELFEEQVEKIPDKVAISYEEKELTYKELNQKANQLAKILRKKDVSRETIVAIMTEHSIETVIGILAVLKAGGAYLPIDPNYPLDRLNYMIEDSGTNILLTNCEINKNINFTGEIINLNNEELYFGDDTNLEIENKPNDLVYIIYTSGSTGKPKGTLIEHKGLINYIWWAKKMYVKHENEVFPLYSSLSFDLTVTSIFTPLISGGKIIVYKDNGEEFVLYKIMRENKSSIIKLTPSHLSLLKDLDNKSSKVKRFIVGGEDLKVSLANSIHESFGGDIEIYNEYGPTETVVGCMIHKYDINKDTGISVPIGIPAENAQIYILDKDMNPLPVGIIGEMYISGDGVARGYLNRDDLTKEKFIDNPFIKGNRMYKTGDMAKFLNSSIIEYSGRKDQQVKIHGHRIEIGEIEKHLVESKNIKNAAVIDIEDDKNGKYLCGYLVVDNDFDESELRDYLSSFLPQYMIPKYFIIVDNIPLTTNGKVNKNLLPKPSKIQEEKIEYVSPKNNFENVLVITMKELFEIDDLSVKENFIRLGGDSIKAIQATSKLKDKGYKIKIQDILAHPVIEEMALYLEIDELIHSDMQSNQEGEILDIPIVKWFFEQEFKNQNHYNQSVMLTLKQNITKETIEIIINELIKHHDSLRINYNKEKDCLYYNDKHLNAFFEVEEYDLSSYSYDNQCHKIRQLGENIKSSFDIQAGILFKSCIFNLGKAGKRLLLTAHHLVVDGVSWRIILEDIYNLFMKVKENKDISMPLKTHSIKKWAIEINKYGKSIAVKDISYWNKINECEFIFQNDFNSQEDDFENCKTIIGKLTKEETKNLLSLANVPYNTTTNELLISALSLTLSSFLKNNNIVIELEGHGREEILKEVDVSRTVGWFTSIYPVNIEVKPQNIQEHLKSVKDQIRQIPNKGLSYSVLRYLSQSIRTDNKKKVRFNYLGDFSNSANNDLFDVSSEDSGKEYASNNEMTCLLDINAMVESHCLDITVTYSSKMFKEITINTILNEFIENLRIIIDHCCSKENVEYTITDFDTLELSNDDLDLLFE